MFKLTEPVTPKVWIKQILFGSLALGMFLSPVFSTSLAQAATVGAPAFPLGPFTTYSKISLTSSTSGASIYYTFSNGGTPANPSTSSYLYNSSTGIDIQQGNQFKVGTYNVKAIAYYNGVYSAVSSASYSITNRDQTSRNTLSSKSIAVNKDDCWNVTKTNCTSFLTVQLVSVQSQVFSEMQTFGASCDKYYHGTTAYNNYCNEWITGVAETGHSNPPSTKTCSHDMGGKFDFYYDVNKTSSAANINNFIRLSGQFYKITNRTDGTSSERWIRVSTGATYSLESNHWDVGVPTVKPTATYTGTIDVTKTYPIPSNLTCT